MPFDDKKYHAPAKRGQLGSVALQASIALDLVADALDAIVKGDPELAHSKIVEIKEKSQKLDKLFDTLTGWTSQEPADE
jgi:hypothetical protein